MILFLLLSKDPRKTKYVHLYYTRNKTRISEDRKYRKVRFLAVRNKNNRGVVRGVSVSLQSRAFLISPRLQSLFTTYCWRGLVWRYCNIHRKIFYAQVVSVLRVIKLVQACRENTNYSKWICKFLSEQ